MTGLRRFFKNPDSPIVFFLLVAATVTLQNYLAGVRHWWGSEYTYYNNYVIFKTSFVHLLQSKNLYVLHLSEYADLYKYSPTFALCMAPFAYLPDFIGLFLWNGINCLALFFVLRNMPGITPGKIWVVVGFSALEIILSTQSSQCNLLVVALIIASYNSFEKGNIGTAAFFIICGTFIKIFAIAMLLFGLMSPKKLRFGAYVLLWLVVFALVPLLVVSPAELLNDYRDWFVLLTKDHAKSSGMSVYSILEHLTGNPAKLSLLFVGVFLLTMPLLNRNWYSSRSARRLFLCSMLLWMVVFNHKGESPSYVIAFVGIGCWLAFSGWERRTIVLAGLSWLLSSAIKTDLVPHDLKQKLNLDFVCALMPTVVFVYLCYSLLTFRQKNDIAVKV